MKLLEAKHPLSLKPVEYFGAEFQVPAETRWLATDANGFVLSYSSRPTIDLECADDRWLYDKDDTVITDMVAIVNLQGYDWKETLVEV